VANKSLISSITKTELNIALYFKSGQRN